MTYKKRKRGPKSPPKPVAATSEAAHTTPDLADPLQDLADAAARVTGQVVDDPYSQIDPPSTEDGAAMESELTAMEEEDCEQARYARLEDLQQLDPKKQLSGTAYEMSVDQMKEERKLWALLHDYKDRAIPSHKDRGPHANAVLRLRQQHAEAMIAEQKKAAMDPEQWNAEDEQIAGTELPVGPDGKRIKWCSNDWAALFLVLGHPENHAALALVAQGHEHPGEARLELDKGGIKDRAWALVSKLWSQPDLELAHPCPFHDTIGLKYMDPMKRYLGWPGQVHESPSQ